MDMSTVKNVRPGLPISAHSLWDMAADRRDEIATSLERELASLNVIAWIRKSKPGEYPLYVAVESWTPMAETEISATFDRAFVKIAISVDPYRTHPLTYEATLSRSGRDFHAKRWTIQPNEIADMAKYLIQGGKRPTFFRSHHSWPVRMAGVLLPFIGNEPRNALIKEARPNYLTLTNLLGWSGVLTIAMVSVLNLQSDPDDVESLGIYPSLLLISVGALVIAFCISRRRPKLDAVPKQSVRTPRREYRIDSWHVSVPGAGADFNTFRQRIYEAAVADSPTPEVNRELHQNLTPRGFEERERLVLTNGQATLHIHVYQFGPNAFVGWESYLNWNRWEESDAVSTTVRDGKLITYHSLKVGVHLPTDFDLIETDVLAETVHRSITDQIKAFLKEREIEADLDFKIIRGDRSKALEEGKEDKALDGRSRQMST